MDADPFLSAWDELAVANSKPYCSPAWMSAWWIHAAPRASVLRVILVFEGDVLVGVAPFFADRALGGLTRFRILGSHCSSRLDLLACPGREGEVASAFAWALGTVKPRPDVVMLEALPDRSLWPELLATAWAGPSPALSQQFTLPAPTISLSGMTYEEWLSSKSRHFRKSMGQRLRELEREGASFRLARTEDEIQQGLRSLAELHYGRWSWRGGSRTLNPRVEKMLAVASMQMVMDGRLQLWSIVIDERYISSHLFLAAGEQTSYWMGGFDERWARLQPSMTTILMAIREAFERGDHRFDLGTGDQEYKHRFADGADVIQWTLLIPRGPRSLLARLHLLPERMELVAARRLPAGAKRLIKQIRNRVMTPGSGSGSHQMHPRSD